MLQELLQDGFKRPQGGLDMGDHPPITPVAAATESELGGGDEWRIYDYISRHFLGSLCPDCVYQKSKATLQAGGETFTASGELLVIMFVRKASRTDKRVLRPCRRPSKRRKLHMCTRLLRLLCSR